MLNWLLKTQSPTSDLAEQRGARLLASLLLFITPMTAVAELAFLLSLPDVSSLSVLTELLFVACVVFALATAYLLNRRGHFRVAAYISCFSLSLIIFFISLPDRETGAIGPVYLLILPIFFASALLDVKATLTLMTINVVGLVVFYQLFSDISIAQALSAPALLLILMTGNIVIIDRHRTQLEQARINAFIASEKRYRRLFNESKDALVLHDGRVPLDANPAFTKLLGYTLDEVGETWTAMILPEYRELVAKRVSSPTAEFYEVQVRTKHGDTLWIEPVDSVYEEDGRQYRLTALRDVTDRKAMDDMRLEVKLAEERTALLQRFIGDATHDFKTPLTVITTSLFVLQNSRDPAKRDRATSAIQQQTKTLKLLFDDLLALSRLETLNETWTLRELDVNDVVQAVYDEHTSLADQKGVELRFVPTDAPQLLLLNRTELHRAVRQLVANAINYTPSGGLVTLKVCSYDDSITIEVEDTGIGIPAEDIPHLFERFYRSKRSRNMNDKGMGIGLAIVKRVAEGHNGNISVHSDVGAGSTFRLNLPLTPPAGSRPSPSPSSHHPH